VLSLQGWAFISLKDLCRLPLGGLSLLQAAFLALAQRTIFGWVGKGIMLMLNGSTPRLRRDLNQRYNFPGKIPYKGNRHADIGQHTVRDEHCIDRGDQDGGEIQLSAKAAARKLLASGLKSSPSAIIVAFRNWPAIIRIQTIFRPHSMRYPSQPPKRLIDFENRSKVNEKCTRAPGGAGPAKLGNSEKTALT
jgi:hypothetical protein